MPSYFWDLPFEAGSWGAGPELLPWEGGCPFSWKNSFGVLKESEFHPYCSSSQSSALYPAALAGVPTPWGLPSGQSRPHTAISERGLPRPSGTDLALCPSQQLGGWNKEAQMPGQCCPGHLAGVGLAASSLQFWPAPLSHTACRGPSAQTSEGSWDPGWAWGCRPAAFPCLELGTGERQDAVATAAAWASRQEAALGGDRELDTEIRQPLTQQSDFKEESP
jgi:hypothetical protein